MDLGIVPDNKELIKKILIKSAKTADAIITSGGVSVGQADYMKEVLAELGNVLFWKLSIKPGRPMAYGKIKSASYFGLPGNPVAAMVTFYQLVQPALKYLKGELNYLPPPIIDVKSDALIKKKPGRLEFQRGILSQNKDGLSVKPTNLQGSAILSSMTQANCFIILDLESGPIKKGDKVKVQLMNGLI
jgi:molybdopterin molybdotransferase